MMGRTFDLAYLMLMTALLIFLLGDVYISFEEAAWRDRCRDAGGIPTSHVVCINPGAVIEVN
jgi:hypothetical protein